MSTSVLYHSGTSRTSQTLGREHRSATALAQQLRPSRPPRPPPPDRPRTITGVQRQTSQSQTLAKTRQYKLMSLDDMSIDDRSSDMEKIFEEPRTSIRLFDDPEIQRALKKSYSTDDILSKSKEESLLEEDEEELFSESSEDEEGVQILAGPPVPPPRRKRPVEYTPSGSKVSSETGSDTSSLSCPYDEVDHPTPPPRRTTIIRKQFEGPLIDLNSPESREDAGSKHSFTDNFVKLRTHEINRGLPSLESLRGRGVRPRECTPEAENAVKKLRDMYVRLEETKNSSPERESSLDLRTIQSRHVGNVQRLKAVYMGADEMEEVPKVVERSSASRSSIISRSPAFKRTNDERPERRRPSVEGSSDIDFFDPLSNASVSSQKMTPTISSEDFDLLKDWSLNFSSFAPGTNTSVPPTSNFSQNILAQNRTVMPQYGSSASQSQNIFVQTQMPTAGYQTGGNFSQISPTGIQRPSPSGSPNSLGSSRPLHSQFMTSPSPPPAQTVPMYPNSGPIAASRTSITAAARNSMPVPAPRTSLSGNRNSQQQTLIGATTSDPFDDLVQLGQMSSSNVQRKWEKFE